MDKIAAVLLIPVVLVCLAGCATSQKSVPNEATVVESAPAVNEQQHEQSYSQVYHQTNEYIWMWVHKTKGKDEFQEDAASCTGTHSVIDTYLTDADKEFMPLWMLPSAAFNKCMFSKGWIIEQKKRAGEE